MLSAETSALYLASKSNYQNILEGTHLPGVFVPRSPGGESQFEANFTQNS